jgi:murein DD-endopeptidase MepM/ murein hydrolase activator NlpD
MKRVLTITAVTALTIGVSVPAAALPTFSSAPDFVTASKVEPQAFVAAATVGSPVVRDAFGVEIIPKPTPVVVAESSSYAGSYSGSFAGTLAMRPASGGVNDGFGYRDGGEFHKGIDIMAGYGATIVAASPGVVTKVGWDGGGWGRYIVVDHGDGVETLYSHAIDGSQMVSAGQSVDAGTPLALVGDTGYVTVAHLHFEVHVSGVATDPYPWLP